MCIRSLTAARVLVIPKTMPYCPNLSFYQSKLPSVLKRTLLRMVSSDELMVMTDRRLSISSFLDPADFLFTSCLKVARISWTSLIDAMRQGTPYSVDSLVTQSKDMVDMRRDLSYPNLLLLLSSTLTSRPSLTSTCRLLFQYGLF